MVGDCFASFILFGKHSLLTWSLLTCKTILFLLQLTNPCSLSDSNWPFLICVCSPGSFEIVLCSLFYGLCCHLMFVLLGKLFLNLLVFFKVWFSDSPNKVSLSQTHHMYILCSNITRETNLFIPQHTLHVM